MKILALVLAVVFLAIATSGFAAFIYWGHPYMGVSHHQRWPSVMGDNSGAFGGCPYLQELHKGIGSKGGDYSYHDPHRGFGFPGPQAPSGDSNISPQQKPIEI